MSDAVAEKKKKPAVSPLLVVLLIVLAVAVGAYLVDMAARHGSEAAYQAVSDKLPSEGELDAGAQLESLTPEDVAELMGRSPDGPAADRGEELVETFTWRGPINRYQVHVVYSKGAVSLATRATLNQPPE